MPMPGGWSAQQAHQQQVQHDRATFARDAHVCSGRGRGPGGRVGRLFGFVLALVFLAVAVWTSVTVLNSVQPDWFDHVTTWFGRLF